MTPFYADEAVTLHHGDALEVLRSLPDASVDAVVTDPPYGLEFMGKEWDRFTRPGFADGAVRAPAPSWSRGAWQNKRCSGCGRIASGGSPCRCPNPVWTVETGKSTASAVAFQRWCEEWTAECLRVLKPGGWLLAFGGTRTVHRLTCAVEDAGFEIRDGIDWLYASGFPKSLDVSKAMDKAAGAQREVVGPRVRLGDSKPYAYNPASPIYGTDNGSVTGVRPPETAPATDDARRWSGWGTALKPAREPIVVARKPLAGTVAANVLAHGTGALNIDACRVEGQPGESWNAGPGGGGFTPESYERGIGRVVPGQGRWPSNVILSHAPDCAEQCVAGCPVAELDAQSGYSKSPPVGAVAVKVARVGQVAKGDEAARISPNGHGDSGGASRFFPVFRYQAKAPTRERPNVDGVAHPTVKPLTLMRWLVRLVTPPGGTVLEPFAGSGTTAEACVLEGFRCIAIEREAAYLPLIVSRLAKPQPTPALFAA